MSHRQLQILLPKKKHPSAGQLETKWNSWITTHIKKSTWGTAYRGNAHAR